MAYFRFGLFALITLASGACVRSEPDFIVPVGHPADLDARSGAVLVGSDALKPELRTVKPNVTPSAAPKPAPSSGAHQHKH